MFKSVISRAAASASRSRPAAARSSFYQLRTTSPTMNTLFNPRMYTTENKDGAEAKKSAATEDTKKAEEKTQDKEQQDSKTGTVSIEEYNKLKKSLAEKDAKIKEIKDAYIRSLAETENIRTRTRAESEQAKQFAIQKFAKDLLDTVDVLHMALKSVPKEMQADKENHKTLADLFEGVHLTHVNLLKTLNRHGVEEMKIMGEKYDPNTAQALYQVPMPGKEGGTVIAVEKIGYTLNGRVIRPAQVGVVLDSEN
ncbi:GrpE, mitochondrial [Mycoemilia scoparia]|uniref:GrpE protein homolog n=1 Tax=Mycoemilia scoparia TaxID=417184 RepID=A0A9W8DRY9_9FUNG|nr:GrpE, mitochondrial [Mycoemilia scoparia]